MLRGFCCLERVMVLNAMFWMLGTLFYLSGRSVLSCFFQGWDCERQTISQLKKELVGALTVFVCVFVCLCRAVVWFCVFQKE